MRNQKSHPYARFISPNILKGLVRPQDASHCSIAAIAASVNALFNVSITPSDVLKHTHWDIDDEVSGGKIENEEMINGFMMVCKALKLSGSAKMLLDKIPEHRKGAEQKWEAIKKAIDDPNSVLIYHGWGPEDDGSYDDVGSYSMVVGYFEEPNDEKFRGTNSYPLRRDWLILAENSDEPTEDPSDPIRCIAWSEVEEEINDDSDYGILIFRRTSLRDFKKGNTLARSNKLKQATTKVKRNASSESPIILM